MRRFALACTLAVTLLGLAAPAAPAAAQTLGNDEISAVTFRPSPGTNRYLMIDGTDIGRHSDLPIDLMVDYAYRPLYVDTFCFESWVMCDDEELESVAVVKQLLAFHLGASLPIDRRIELGLSLPILYASGDGWGFDDVGGSPRQVEGGSAFGIGDPMLAARLRIYGGSREDFGLAAVAYGTVPLGQLAMEGRHVGDDLPNAGGHLVGELFVEELRAAVLLGGLFRAPRELTGEFVGPMFTYGGAVEWSATDMASVLGEFQGGIGFGDATAQLELRAAGRLDFGPVDLTAGAGLGLVRGPGVPVVRLFAGVRFAPLPQDDRDGDGIPDPADECPDEPEDEDDFADDDGCPDPDNDQDGIPDEDDRCPNDPEDVDEVLDDDGCPDPDDDGDGVPDGYDSCRHEKEDYDGDRDEDGCPDEDRDRDGVDDDVDQCPDEPEDTDGLQDEDGCPEEDADGDGVPDVEDECPEIPGTNCHDDTDGDGVPDIEDPCPEMPGTHCPPDADEDGIPDTQDRCPSTPGTECPDVDTDGDGIPDVEDRCPMTPGTDCPPDADGDGIPDPEDRCPTTPGTDCPSAPAPPPDDGTPPTPAPPSQPAPPAQRPDAGTPQPPPGGGGIDWSPPE